MKTIGTKELRLYGAESPILVLMIAEHGEGEAVYTECAERGAEDFCLASIQGVDWNAELSPWPAEPIFPKGEAFRGEGDRFLQELEEKLLPEILAQLPRRPEQIIFAGYSLAGLLCLYSGYRMNCFQGIVSASGSLWYPGFLDYMRTHEPEPELRAVYLSVGDREAKTKNPMMRTVEDNTRAAAELLLQKGRSTIFETNPGNHFVDDDKRLAKGICWCLQQLKESKGGE